MRARFVDFSSIHSRGQSPPQPVGIVEPETVTKLIEQRDGQDVTIDSNGKVRVGDPSPREQQVDTTGENLDSLSDHRRGSHQLPIETSQGGTLDPPSPQPPSRPLTSMENRGARPPLTQRSGDVRDQPGQLIPDHRQSIESIVLTASTATAPPPPPSTEPEKPKSMSKRSKRSNPDDGPGPSRPSILKKKKKNAV